MRTDIPAALIRAAMAYTHTPICRVTLHHPLDDRAVLNLSPYVQTLLITLPPSYKPGILKLTCTNPKGKISLSPLFQADYELRVELGYQTRSGPQLARVGTFWLDTPQHTLTANPPKNTVTIQGRDVFKLALERHFSADEYIDFGGQTLKQAVTNAIGLINVNGKTPTVAFDTDALTTQALAVVTQQLAGPTDPSKNMFTLLRDVIGEVKLLVYGTPFGGYTVGMKSQTSPAVVSFGRVTGVQRPIYFRDVRRSALETSNFVYVLGNTTWATASDPDNIADIGRIKYKYLDVPTLEDAAACRLRANQELGLASRFREQPDIEVPWFLDLERRDVVTIDDQAGSDIPRGNYRIEDMRFTYTSGTTPKATVQLGMAMLGVDDVDEDSGTFE